MKKYEGYALITGGTGGIGLEFAKQLADKGYNLVLVARNKDKLAADAKGLMKKYSVDVVTISQDLSKIESTEVIFEALKKKKIHVGLLINNAGFGLMGNFHELSHQKSLEMLNVMCLSLTDLTYKFLPGMLAKGSGGIIFLSSIAGQLPGPYFAVYSSAKAFSLHFALSLHAEYEKKGLDILAVCPGGVDSHFFRESGEGVPVPAKTALLSPVDVAAKSLDALGKQIVITIPNDMKTRVGLVLKNVMPYSAIEKVSQQVIKDLWGMD
jgi:short-subunit dehydrogenase